MHKVKCPYCGKQFDRDKEPFIQEGRRYAHPECVQHKEEILTQEEKDRRKLNDYINYLFHTEFVPPLIQKQIKAFMEQYNYTYSGILKSLIYFYEVQHNSIEKANGGISIVPYIYQRAYEYYYAIWLAQQKNENKNIEEYIPEEIEIVIPRPKAKPHKKHLFTFLDMEDE